MSMNVVAEQAGNFNLTHLTLTDAQRYAHKTSEKCPYKDLKMSDEQKEAIKEIMKILAKSWVKIGISYSQLIEKGNLLYGTHPFKQFAVILTEKTARKNFQTVFQGYQGKYSWIYNLIAKKYFDELSRAFIERQDVNGLDCQDHIQGFAKEIRGDEATIRCIIKECSSNRNWAPFMVYLGTFSP